MVTCKRAIATPISLSTDLIPIRVAVGPEGLEFFNVSGEHILIHWPWSTIVCFRHYEVFIKVMAIYILADDVMKNVLKPIFLQTLCSKYLLTLSFHVAYTHSKLRTVHRYQCRTHVSDRLFKIETCPYYMRPFCQIDARTGQPEVENIFEIISTELSVYIPGEALLASRNRILAAYLQRTPHSVYVPNSGHEFEEVEGISIKTLTLIKESDDTNLKVQFLVLQNQKMAVKEIFNSLGIFSHLPSSIKPEDKFKLYHEMHNGVMKWLIRDTILDNWMDTVYFKDKATTKPTDKVSSPNSAKLVSNMKTLSLSDNSRKSPGNRKIQSPSSKHPLQNVYHPPQSGSLAPSNTPERVGPALLNLPLIEMQLRDCYHVIPSVLSGYCRKWQRS